MLHSQPHSQSLADSLSSTPAPTMNGTTSPSNATKRPAQHISEVEGTDGIQAQNENKENHGLSPSKASENPNPSPSSNLPEADKDKGLATDASANNINANGNSGEGESDPATKKRKLSPVMSKEAKQHEKEINEQRRLENKAKKEEEKRVKEDEKKKRDAERELKKKARDEEKAAKEEKRQKIEEEKFKKDRVSLLSLDTILNLLILTADYTHSGPNEVERLFCQTRCPFSCEIGRLKFYDRYIGAT